ncbi:MAG: GIY-YIG nuclease family protein [Planctomycetaceae bacterium]|nr:GIY-YIG nuclease family protein [Planctomycetaceae bacterium]
MTGKTIRLYLVDGVSHGVMTAEVINWTGKIIVAPRSQLVDLSRRDEVKRTGIYCLAGPDPDQPERDRVYIGEGDNVLKRLLAHEKDESKEFWTRTAVIISKDDNITKSHGRYVESRLIRMATEAGRASLANGSHPDPPPLPESDVADMEFFVSQIQLILPVLGMNFLQPKPNYEVSRSDRTASQRFVMKEGDRLAYAFEQGGEFVVMKGSPARKEGAHNWVGYRSLRDSLIERGLLLDEGDATHYVFVENVPFASPSGAAAVVAAGNRNGRTYWRVEETGQTYGDWQDSLLNDSESVGEDE